MHRSDSRRESCTFPLSSFQGELPKGQVVSRETIQARVWGSDSQSTYNSIEVYLTLLRRKLRSIGSEAQICAERGLGYYLAE